MKINKRGTQPLPSSTSNAFISRKNSLKENQAPSQQQPILSQTQNLNTLVKNERTQGLGSQISESQPVLAKANERPNIQLLGIHTLSVHKRNPTTAMHQNQLSLGESVPIQSLSGNSSSYMLKLQKYKKMKGELQTQSKSTVKKFTPQNQHQQSVMISDTSKLTISTINSHKASNQSVAQQISQTTKNSTNPHILFEQSVKENSNPASNQPIHISNQPQLDSTKNNKAQTLKFSINNFLSEINQKQSISHLKLKNDPPKIMMKNVIKSSQKSQQQLISQKMMAALHKKCNSIVNASNVSNYVKAPRESSTKLQSSNVTCLVLDQDSNYNSVPHQAKSKITPNVSSQVEFFDENVRVNQVPQITPRHQEKRKTMVLPNERYKNIDLNEDVVLMEKPSKDPLKVIEDFYNRQNASNQQKSEKRESQAMLSLKPQRKEESVKIPNNRYKDEIVESSGGDSQILAKSVFELKRRSCGPVEQGVNNLILTSRLAEKAQNDLLQSQRDNNEMNFQNFGLRKFSQQVQFNNKLLNKQEEIQTQRLSQHHIIVEQKPQIQRQEKSNPKDEILNFFSKYIKQNNYSVQVNQQYDETIQNLKDFLQYLEDKNIINCKKLENDKEEMSNLIKDLMKLDLNKFTGKNAQTCKSSPNNQDIKQPRNHETQPKNLRRNSGEFQKIIKSPEQQHQMQHKLPLNSPNNEFQKRRESSNNIVCYFAPVNVSGHGNVVNTNFQIFHGQTNKAYNCSQKLFSGSNSIDEEQIQLIENLQLRLEDQQKPQDQPIFFKQVGHKRVKSIGSVNQVNPKQMQLILPPQQQIANQIDSSRMMQFQDKNNAQYFHQRKNSLVLNAQNEQQDFQIQMRNQFYPHHNSVEETNDESTMVEQQKCRLSHRRATTNFIQPLQIIKNIQTIQPTSQISTGYAFIDDNGLTEDRDKLVNYIKAYTKQRFEVPKTSLDHYKFLKLIGKGAFGKVTLGIHKLTGKQVAIKTVDKSLMKDEYQKRKVLQEVHLLKKVRHQNVIRLLEVFESPKHLLMVMEYAGGGDLLQYVKKRRRLDEEEARRIFRQVVYGLAHCHCRSVLHRDIKLDNILLDNEGEIKICDFGVSRIIKKNHRITEQCGTPAYIAPEIISDSGYDGFSADIWSLGVLLYAMLCGTVPFKAQNMHDLHKIITSGSFQFPSQIEPLLSFEAKDLISKMLVLNPKNRITVPEILSHAWMVSKEDLMFQDDMIEITNGTILNKKDMFGMGFNPANSGNEEPDINQVVIDNLFAGSNSYQAKLSYTDYCAITQDFATMHMNEEVLQVMEGMGFPRKLVRDGLNKGELNHATATYNLLVLN